MKLIFSKIKHFFITMQDVLITDVCYVLPHTLKWFYHRRIKRDISVIRFKNCSGKRASLYQHGTWKFEKSATPVIVFLHGQYSHPLVMQHLAEIAKETQIGATFSLYLPYDKENLDSHRSLLKQAIDHIEKTIMDEGSSLKGIILVGHSMGAIEAAYIAFVEADKRILSVISIAGRLKVVESNNNSYGDPLKDTLNAVYKGIHANPRLPLYQIVGRHDWNASIEVTIIRKDRDCFHIVEDGMHFNILFHQDIYRKLPEFLRKSL